MEFHENVVLAPYTTFGIGGAARWLATAASEADVVEGVAAARKLSLPLLVLGGGSNVLISDDGFAGLVLRIAIKGIQQHEATNGPTMLTAGAGEDWDDLVRYAVDHDLAGMECLAGIPGTVGGTPVQNVGAYGQEVAQTIQTVRCYDTHGSMFVDLSNRQCGFAYRTSLLNTTERGRYIVTRVDFSLMRSGAANLSYPDLRKRFPVDAHPSLRQVADTVREIRRGKSMVIDPADPNTRSAGSFFRNPVVARKLLPRVAEAAGVLESEVPNWPGNDQYTKLPAAWLLERAGFRRGYAMGAAGISSRHTLALINRGGATSQEIKALRDFILATVQDRFEITLEQEPVSIG